MNIQKMMKQAQQLQSRMTELQDQLAAAEISGSAGGGLVTVTLSGKGEARRISVDPSLIVADEADVLEDLLVAAFNDAKAKVEAHMAERMAEITGGLKLPPGLQLPF